MFAVSNYGIDARCFCLKWSGKIHAGMWQIFTIPVPQT